MYGAESNMPKSVLEHWRMLVDKNRTYGRTKLTQTQVDANPNVKLMPK